MDTSLDQRWIAPECFERRNAGATDCRQLCAGMKEMLEERSPLLHAAHTMLVNHAFAKKTQKTPKKEILVAEQRKKEYLRDKQQT
ncbi:hypothetical protein LDFHOB_14530 [Candidatus Electronema aureum]